MQEDDELEESVVDEAGEGDDLGREVWEESAASAEDLPSAGLLSFYDRLRDRILWAVERRGGPLGSKTVRALLLVPDVFILLVRLSLDPKVPYSSRALIGGALAYFVLPFDLFPEGLVGVGGYVDDLVLALTVVAQAFGNGLEHHARRHWSGSEDLRVVLHDMTSTAESLLGADLYQRLKGLLARRGVELEGGEVEPAEPVRS